MSWSLVVPVEYSFHGGDIDNVLPASWGGFQSGTEPVDQYERRNDIAKIDFKHLNWVDFTHLGYPRVMAYTFREQSTCINSDVGKELSANSGWFDGAWNGGIPKNAHVNIPFDAA